MADRPNYRVLDLIRRKSWFVFISDLVLRLPFAKFRRIEVMVGSSIHSVEDERDFYGG